MTHVGLFVDVLYTFNYLLNISGFYWVESDSKNHFLSGVDCELKMQRLSISVLYKLWQILKLIFNETNVFAAIFYKISFLYG